jgi:beta-glucuronidase
MMPTGTLPILLCSLCAGAAAAPPVELIQNVAARQNVTLNGPWRAIVDPYENGYYDYRHQPLADGGYAANQKPQSKSDHVEYDFDTASQLLVPGDWNTQRPELFLYEGAMWYERTFDYRLRSGRRLFVWFGAANYDAIVFLNGTRLGQHLGGFTPFQFEITSLVREKGNFLVVLVNDQRHPEAVPTVNTDWWNYGGLTRQVRLVDVPETFVEDYLVQLAKGSRSRIEGWVRLNGSRKRQRVTVRIPEAGAEASAETDENGFARIAFDARLALWSPENPKLYDVSIEADSDRVKDRIGFRSIETSGRQILLNGKPIFLRGASIHGEAPFRQGRVFNEGEARTLLGWAKELGCNFVRLAHYPHDEAMTRAADEMGLLVWSEIPVYWTIEWENRATLENAQRQLAEMIARDRNRASIILWSVANETPPGEPRLKFLAALATRAHELDPTRLVTAALEQHSNGNTMVVDDPLSAYLDVVSCNEYLGWYVGSPDMPDRAEWKVAYDKPFVFSEFGAEALEGLHGDDMTAWTEEFQANVYRHQVAMFRRIPFLGGTIAWVLVDFRSPRRPLAGIQDFFNRKGLVSDRGNKKLAFDVLRDYYHTVEPPAAGK